MAAESRLLGYVGTYTGAGSNGVQVISLDAESGKMERVSASDRMSNPSFVALDGRNRTLYAAIEVDEYDGRSEGAIAAFAVENGGETLSLRQVVGSGGKGPCHVAVAPGGSHVAVANYGGGSVSIFGIGPGGGFGARTAFVKYSGHGVDRLRQEAPHAHSVTFSPGGRALLVADLGTDRIHVYRYDGATGDLTADEPVMASPGAGPRHLAFDHSGTFCYVSYELSSEVAAYGWQESGRELEHLGTWSTRPGRNGANTVADIHLAPTGSHLLCSNRGDDTLSIFSVTGGGRTLQYLDAVHSRGRTPRNFTFVEGTNLLVVANQDSDELISFRFDAGLLNETGYSLSLSRPVCVGFSRSQLIL